jgi:toxin ParE1/3/4
MAFRILITPQAEADIAAICRYTAVELCNPLAAAGLADALYDAVESLEELPLRHPVWRNEPWKSRGIRSIGVKNYRIFYLADTSSMRVLILRVFYNRSDT